MAKSGHSFKGKKKKEAPDPVSVAATNFDKERLRNFFTSLDVIDNEQASVSEHRKDVMEAVKSAGFDVKIVKLVHGLRKMGKSGRQEQDYLVEAYRRAIGIGESQESAEYTAENAQREAEEADKVKAAVESIATETAPENPEEGDVWLNKTTGDFHKFVDGYWINKGPNVQGLGAALSTDKATFEIEVIGDGPLAKTIRGEHTVLEDPPADGKDGDEWINPRTATVYKMIGGAWLPKPVENKTLSKRVATMEDGTKYNKDTGELVESRPIASVEDGAI
jgi:uncharacterized protein (UPF0335 family)